MRTAFPDQQLFELAQLPFAPAVTTGGLVVAAAPATGRIWAELVDAPYFASLVEAWTALAARADVPNVFMDPAAASAVAEAWPRPVRILLGWHGSGSAVAARKLVGVWMLVEGRPRQTWPFRALVAPSCAVAYLGTPVLDPIYARPVLAAMFDLIRQTPGVPKLLQAGDLSDGPVMENLTEALAVSSGSLALIERRTRAKLATRLDPATYWASSMSQRSRQGFARKRRQLARLGKLDFISVTEPAEVAVGVEAFLALEASGWKAARESALASDDATARFTRQLAGGLAGREQIAVQSLRLNGLPIAMWLILYSGSAAFTWRTAYDERYGRFSPGVLLLEEATIHLLRDARIASTDSCNHQDRGYQAERWAQRHDVVDVLIDLGAARPLRLRLLAARERLFRQCRHVARRAWHLVRDAKAALAARLRRQPAAPPAQE